MNKFTKLKEKIYMPKIRKGARESLIIEARRQLGEIGYSSMTVRSVASAVGVGVGTLYNYFSSKDELVAECMLEAWVTLMAKMAKDIEDNPTPINAASVMLSHLRSYLEAHRSVMEDKAAKRVFAAALAERHKLVRDSLVAVVRPVAKSEFGAEFFAEALLAWSNEDKTKEELIPFLVYALEN